jgi:hypothetical protein
MNTATKSIVWICIFSTLFTGCYSAKQLSRDEIVPGDEYDIREVVTTTGEHFVMEEVAGSGGMLKDSTIIAVVEKGKATRIPLSKVRSVQVSEFNGAETAFFIIIGVPIGLFAMAGLAVAAGGMKR